MNTSHQKSGETGARGAAARALPKELVFGLGETGLSVARYFARSGRDARFIDTRQQPPGMDELGRICPGAEVILGDAPRGLLKSTTRIIVSPGIADREPLLAEARAAGIEVVSDIELFVEEARAPFIAVTGSNGKSTVTSLLALMFDAAGRPALAGANLGNPALDLLAEPSPHVYVLELSSFQLMRTRNLPAQVAVLLNVSDDHLDWHSSAAEYREAKYRVFREAKAAVFNRSDGEVVKAIPQNVRRVSFGPDEPPARHYGLVTEEGEQFLAYGEQMLLAAEDMALAGGHNHLNALAALAVGRLMGLEFSPMLQVLMEFPGLPHRMQFVATVGGIDYIDDSKATNIGAAVASITSIQGPVVLIAGGEGKGGDFAQLAQAVRENLKAAILIGRDGPAMARALKGVTSVYQAANMDTAVSVAANVAGPGDTVLLAPACASLDQYRNYAERGMDFRRAVGALTQ
ncbi:MAG TPA: UDP-N-acetylmuramoyl-L-alanine--D-glutamate ligase [Woeseiaceae bacterium]|nr:UDP-N-acetylmuramoyl-L-alanine--D-glutamate ligase [Woeseiaceae bacterium]